MLNVFSEVAWEELLATVKIMNTIPYTKLTSATISAGFKAFKGPPILGPRMSPAARCRQASRPLRQPDPVLQLPGQG